MKTQEQIVKRIEAAKASGADVLGFAHEVLVLSLDFEHAKRFLKPGTQDDWPVPSEEAIRAEARAYLEFAWGKAEDHRWISAERSVDKLTAWAWVLGDDALVEAIEQAGYAQYGAPKLDVIAKAWGVPRPVSAALDRMVEGLPCQPDCDEGCGQ